MSNKKRLVFSIIQFLNEELKSDNLSSDSKESIEVAVQCLEAAFEVNTIDGSLQTNKSLENIFEDYMKTNENSSGVRPQIPVTEEQRKEAERLKNEGNELMKCEQFSEALDLYGRAIELDASNAVYYCNRAAAHSKLNNHELALDDCKRAISYDPNYSKAYGRMGLAFGNLNEHSKSRDCYRKALELDPNNESYRNNLKIAEDKVAEQQSSNPFGMTGNPFDLSSLLSNPALMNMASQLMSDPNMQNLMGGLMSGAMPGAMPGTMPGPNTETEGGGPSGGGIEALLQAGQQIAAQMQAANPDLVDQLRSAMTGQNQDPNQQNESNPNDNNNPNEDKKSN